MSLMFFRPRRTHRLRRTAESAFGVAAHGLGLIAFMAGGAVALALFAHLASLIAELGVALAHL